MKTANLVKAVCVAGTWPQHASWDWPPVRDQRGHSRQPKAYTGGVAATVNGTEIPEDDHHGA